MGWDRRENNNDPTASYFDILNTMDSWEDSLRSQGKWGDYIQYLKTTGIRENVPGWIEDEIANQGRTETKMKIQNGDITKTIKKEEGFNLQGKGIPAGSESCYVKAGRKGIWKKAAIITKDDNPPSWQILSTKFDEDEPKVDEEADKMKEYLAMSVDELELSVRSSNCLKNANIRTVAELVQKTDAELLKTRNFGKKSLNEIKTILSEMNLSLNMKLDNSSTEKGKTRTRKSKTL